jgi:O-succinylbenzoic acid--CoA ligase
VPAGPDGLTVLLPALRAALDGSGPAIALLPGGVRPEYHASIGAAVQPGVPVPPEVAVVAATSGSTGDPAGVLLPATALRAAAQAFARRVGAPDGHRWVAALPLHHAGGLMVAVRSAIAATEPVAVASLGGAEPFTVAAFAAATQAAVTASADGRPLAVSLVPAMLATLDDAGAVGWELLRAYDVVLVGGAAVPRSLVDRLRGAGVRVVRSYGMTETCGGVVLDGWPLDGSRVEAGTDGRLRVCGAQVAMGYRDGRWPRRWAPAGDGSRCFRTDDLGAVGADRHVTVHGRSDDVVQVGGASVSLLAVADALRADPRVAAAEVVAVPDARLGARPVALVVPNRGACGRVDQPLADALAELAAARLGRAGQPRVRLVPQIPLLESGKPDRAALAELARAALAGPAGTSDPAGTSGQPVAGDPGGTGGTGGPAGTGGRAGTSDPAGTSGQPVAGDPGGTGGTGGPAGTGGAPDAVQ